MVTRDKKNIGKKKAALINEYVSRGIKVGDTIIVDNEYMVVEGIEGDIVSARFKEAYKAHYGIKKIHLAACKQDVFNIGANPFPKNDWHKRVNNVAFDLESIIFNLYRDDVTGRDEYVINGHKVHETNFNPYVVGKDGERYYFQRPYVWTTEDKQRLIESIYLGISCGQILVREHGWKEVEKAFNDGDYEMCFFDVVDGKQRLNAVYEFIRGDFPDMHGNYYNDLSDYAQMEFGESKCFTYAVMGVGTTDEDVINAFLGVNFTGVPQSAEHIEYVHSLYEKIVK